MQIRPVPLTLRSEPGPAAPRPAESTRLTRVDVKDAGLLGALPYERLVGYRHRRCAERHKEQVIA
ncbi:hypothetical protein EBF04_26000 [Streptomyces sp. I6]|nr:hypothetical protein EBF04_26000 [Streptomyces sp. I6]